MRACVLVALLLTLAGSAAAQPDLRAAPPDETRLLNTPLPDVALTTAAADRIALSTLSRTKPLVLGFVFTLTSFTCTVPIVGALLVEAVQGDLTRPILGMMAFSATFAFPFFFLALFPSALPTLPRAGSWMNAVKITLGMVELALAFKFFSNADLVFEKYWKPALDVLGKPREVRPLPQLNREQRRSQIKARGKVAA